MEPRKLLLQLDVDPQPSAFDRIVALDAGADDVLSYGGVTVPQVQSLVHGAIFTRGPKQLHRTAIFFGGSDASAAESLLVEAQRHLLPQFGLRVSLMLDPNGANTTAAAAIHLVHQRLALTGARVLVLGTGPVGRRLALLAANLGAQIRLGGIVLPEVEAVASLVRERHPQTHVTTSITATPTALSEALADRQIVLAAGPAGKQLLAPEQWQAASQLRILADLNAVPPLGIDGVKVSDAGQERDGRCFFGALGIGQLKMKLHQEAIARLFTRNDLVLDETAMLELASETG
jgi:hypothetical protein